MPFPPLSSCHPPDLEPAWKKRRDPASRFDGLIFTVESHCLTEAVIQAKNGCFFRLRLCPDSVQNLQRLAVRASNGGSLGAMYAKLLLYRCTSPVPCLVSVSMFRLALRPVGQPGGSFSAGQASRCRLWVTLAAQAEGDDVRTDVLALTLDRLVTIKPFAYLLVNKLLLACC